MDLDELRPLIDLEFERARRYARPLGLAVLGGGRPERMAVRVPDLVVRLDPLRTVLLAPETDGKALRVCAGRLATQAGADLLGTADFPSDGPVFEALLAAAAPSDRARRAELRPA